jgi:phosphomannomutase
MEKISLEEIKNITGIGFGTSGVRGLVTGLTDEVVYAYSIAFLKYLADKGDKFDKVALAGDLRESTPRIMRIVGRAILDVGAEIVNCGLIPTQTLAWYGIKNKIPSIMVTGSHIPEDRNGIKFYKPEGEVLKSDEEIISSMEIEKPVEISEVDLPEINYEASLLYFERFLKIFPLNSLKGMKIGLYGHSAVGRDIFENILVGFGAEVTKLGYSDEFVPVDTEVVEEKTVELGKIWNSDHKFEALVSTDGDSDRPLLGDESGNWLRSDILGILTAKYLKAKVVVNPISCNTALDKSNLFEKIVKTKIGSPFVVAEMMRLEKDGFTDIVGYEANGGFLTQDLPTRDGILPLICWLILSKSENKSISKLMSELPKRFTESGSVRDFPTEKSMKIIDSGEALSKIQNVFGVAQNISNIDGLRITLANGEIIHLRPSKNTPEFRNYVEANSPTRAKELSAEVSKVIQSWNI